MRLIDADALVEKAYWHGEHPDVGNPFAEGVEAVDMSDIDNAPTIEAEPVRHGRWIKRPDERICPFCNDRHSYFGGKEKNYCPNCGAKMDLED
jgi:hypothetical protein